MASPQTEKNKQDSTQKSMKYQRDKDREKVKGIFKFYEIPGGSLSFNYRAYKGDPIERFDMVDGEVYTIPLGVARHLNKNGWYPIHHFAQDETGHTSMKIGQKKRRFGFQSLEFADIDDFEDASKEIVTVEKV